MTDMALVFYVQEEYKLSFLFEQLYTASTNSLHCCQSKFEITLHIEHVIPVQSEDLESR